MGLFGGRTRRKVSSLDFGSVVGVLPRGSVFLTSSQEMMMVVVVVVVVVMMRMT